MFKLNLYYATVIDNDDQNHDDGEKLGRIQVKLLPEMNEIEDAKLPWVRPFIQNGMSADQFSYWSPEIDDKIWVVFLDDYFKNGYYFNGCFIDGFFDFDSIESDLGNIDELSDTTYPDIKFKRYPDGTIEFHNTGTGDRGIYHNTGTYHIIDTNGHIYVNTTHGTIITINDSKTEIEDSSGSKITMESSGTTVEDSGGAKIKLESSGITVEGTKVTLKTGDAIIWSPNILGNCLFTGAPHGGSTGGIINLSGA